MEHFRSEPILLGQGDLYAGKVFYYDKIHPDNPTGQRWVVPRLLAGWGVGGWVVWLVGWLAG